MRLALLVALLAGASASADEARRIVVVNDESGSRLEVDGKPLMVRGVNWDYSPVGTNYTYSLWERPEAEIKAALDHEMALLKAGRVNVIRVYSGIPSKWIRYIYETYGIFTVLNHTVGRYGMTIDNVWHPITDYSDPRTREVLRAEIGALVDGSDHVKEEMDAILNDTVEMNATFEEVSQLKENNNENFRIVSEQVGRFTL